MALIRETRVNDEHYEDIVSQVMMSTSMNSNTVFLVKVAIFTESISGKYTEVIETNRISFMIWNTSDFDSCFSRFVEGDWKLQLFHKLVFLYLPEMPRQNFLNIHRVIKISIETEKVLYPLFQMFDLKYFKHSKNLSQVNT